MNTNKITVCLLALLALAWGPAAYAADNNTEFGIEDDLTVFGTGGTAVDPDMEIKGFAVFGATQAAPALNIPVGPGNIFANGYVQVSSGMYVAGSSTFTSAAYFTGISSFTAGPGSIYISGGAANQVLKKVAGGGLAWANDDGGSGSITGTPRRITMIDPSGTGLVSSLLLQNGTDAGVTLMNGSSMTVTGALEAFGAAKFNDGVTLGDAAGDAILSVGGFTAQNGLDVTGGNVMITNNLTVNANAQLGDAVGDTHGINRAAEAGVALSVDSVGTSGNYAAKFYSGGSLAAWIKKK